ncbi:MAG: hypothetical protein JW822_05170 [Spirochaetales bacterium]|nr:hypothetical protein [Spirochaetales bacterium]
MRIKPLPVLTCLVLLAVSLIVTGCRTAGITPDQNYWDTYFNTPFQERVFEADDFILGKLKDMNLTTQRAYAFTRDEKPESEALPAADPLYEVIRKILSSLDPKIRRFVEKSFIGVFPVTNIVNGVGTLVPVQAADRLLYYILVEHEPLYMFISGGSENPFKTRYAYDYGRNDFFSDDGKLLAEGETTWKLDELRRHYRRMFEIRPVGIIIHELGHLVHYKLTEAKRQFHRNVYVPRDFFDLSWAIDSRGRVVSRFADQQQRINELDMRTKDGFAKSVEILRETNLANLRAFMDPEEDFATAFEQYALWRSGLEDGDVLDNCTAEKRFAAKKQYFERLFAEF